MTLHDEINGVIEELREENKGLKEAQDKDEEMDALKELLDGFLRGAQAVREYMDRYNERRWQR